MSGAWTLLPVEPLIGAAIARTHVDGSIPKLLNPLA